MSEYDKIAHLYDEFLFFNHEKVYFDSLIEFIDSTFLNEPNLNVLDIACGTGNVLSRIEKSNTCIGIDNSIEMLTVAESKLKKSTLYQQDFKSFSLPIRFDLILCLFDSLNHTTSIHEVFKSVKNHLNADGVFIFDYYTKYGLDISQKASNKNLSVKKINNQTYKWFINIQNIKSTITEYVIVMEDFLNLIAVDFDFILYNQDFNIISQKEVKNDMIIFDNQIERIVVVAKLS